MRKLLLPFALACAIVLAFGVYVFGQTPPPLTSIRVEDAAALAVSGDGQRLFVADSQANRLSVFDFSNRDSLELLTSVTLDGRPVDVAAGQAYAIVLVEVDGAGDLMEVVAPDEYADGGYGLVAFFEIPDRPRKIVLSPDYRWASVIGDDWHHIYQLISATDNVRYPLADEPRPLLTSFAEGLAFTAVEDPSSVQQYILRPDQPPRPARTLALDEPPTQIALNARMTLGAALVGESVLKLFDPVTMDQIGDDINLQRPIVQMQFVVREDGDWLAALTDEGSELLLLPVVELSAMGEIGALPVAMEPSRMVAYDDRVVVSDGQQISVFSLD
jgi:hypothetical protein